MIERWLEGDRGDQAAELAWEATTAGYRRAVAEAGGMAFAIVLPTMIATISIGWGYSAPLDLIDLLVGATLLVGLAVSAGLSLVEFFAGPVRSFLRRTELTTPRGRLSSRLRWVVSTMALTITAVIGSVAVDRSTDGAGALLPMYGLGLAATVVLAILMVPVVAGAVAAPIDALINGNRQIGRGDLSAQVSVTTDDEFGELAASFNAMVDGLRERESLRGENQLLVDELRSSRARIVAASDVARRNVERDLHDGAQQSLVLLNLKLGMLERKAESDPELVEQVAQVRSDLDRALAELRDLAHGIYPQVLTTDGLPAALAEAAAGAPIEVELSMDGTGRCSPEIEAAIYFCCLEALQNAAKHAGDDVTVAVSLSRADGRLAFEVTDDGAGFDLADDDGGGLQNMADRIGALGGELTVESSPGAGTRVVGSVPAPN